MPATVILNPYSNRWKAQEQAPEVKALLTKAGIEYEFLVMEAPEHGIQLAREAVLKGNTPLIAAGGDGGISEVVNGMMAALGHNSLPIGPLGVIPMGTANDFTDGLGIPRDLEQAVGVIAAGKERVIDLGTVNGRFFDNNSAIGLEPVVTIENIRLTWLKGVIRYMVSAVLAILKHPTWQAEMTWDGGSYEGSLALVSVGNSNRTGGVFHMTPDAIMDDGKLDFVYAPALSRFRMFQLLPKTQTGEHIHEPDIHMHRTEYLKIKTKNPTPIQADGEVFTESATEIEFRIIPQGLRVFVP
ncbi:MAG: diacylglycerol kinase family lipid kinase [Anaerolineaceae bacterium]|nr:diacylglycerol kinase family lipid kinase [Anaerolineaceae bacterium]